MQDGGAHPGYARTIYIKLAGISSNIISVQRWYLRAPHCHTGVGGGSGNSGGSGGGTGDTLGAIGTTTAAAAAAAAAAVAAVAAATTTTDGVVAGGGSNGILTPHCVLL